PPLCPLAAGGAGDDVGMSFAVLQPPRILFGRGTAAQAWPAAQGFGPRGLVVHGASPGRAAAVLGGRIFDENSGLLAVSVAQEPDLPALESARARARPHAPARALATRGRSGL